MKGKGGYFNLPPDGLRLRIDSESNGTFMAYVDDPNASEYDQEGALYYVVAVILIYGLSIVMMVASHIRKNSQDSQLRTYLKDMAALRKNDRRDKVCRKLSDLAQAKFANVLKGSNKSDNSGEKANGESPTLVASSAGTEESNLLSTEPDIVVPYLNPTPTEKLDRVMGLSRSSQPAPQFVYDSNLECPRNNDKCISPV